MLKMNTQTHVMQLSSLHPLFCCCMAIHSSCFTAFFLERANCAKTKKVCHSAWFKVCGLCVCFASLHKNKFLQPFCAICFVFPMQTFENKEHFSFHLVITVTLFIVTFQKLLFFSQRSRAIVLDTGAKTKPNLIQIVSCSCSASFYISHHTAKL